MRAIAERLTEKLTSYYLINTIASARAQVIGTEARFEAEYNAAVEQWTSDPQYPNQPPADNEDARKAFYEKVDEICAAHTGNNSVQQ